MKVLVTGVSGFIGAKLLAAACAAFGAANVIAFSSRPSAGCRGIVYGDGPAFSLGAAELAMLAEVEVLLHAGAFTPKSGAEANDLAGCNSNIDFTHRLLRLPMPALGKVVYLSTLDVYAPAEPITEATPTLPATLYGQSKLYCEKMVESFGAAHAIRAQVLRIGHVYGPGEEKYAKFLPQAIRNIAAGKPVELWGDGAELRSFIYIDDVAAAVVKAVTLDAEVGVINVVGGTPVSIRALVTALAAASGKPVEIVQREWHGAKRNYVFDTSKMRAHLLAHETALADGLRKEYQHIGGAR
ncbi:MAG TPA: NAD-dependent epimerase/dehydratase family protein [Telluria sp.]|nr:NAD-dependent epimerase/dehydratase family protein [Telluria sp.]